MLEIFNQIWRKWLLQMQQKFVHKAINLTSA